MVRSAILHERNKMKTKCRKGGEEIPAGKRTKKQSPELPVFAGVLSLSLSLSLSLVPSDKVCCPSHARLEYSDGHRNGERRMTAAGGGL